MKWTFSIQSGKIQLDILFCRPEKSFSLNKKGLWGGHYNSVQNGCQEPWLYATNSAGMCISSSLHSFVFGWIQPFCSEWDHIKRDQALHKS